MTLRETTITDRTATAPLIAISANSAWNILNFRSGLVEALQGEGYRLAALVPDDSAVADLGRLGVEVVRVPMSPRGLSPLRDLLLLSRYTVALGRLRPAAFLGFTAKPNIYGSLAAAIRGTPVINTLTGLGTGFLSGSTLERVISGLYRVALRNSRLVFFHNRDDLQLFVERGIVAPAQAKVIAGSGVDLEHFAAQPQPQRQPPTFLFIGRMLTDKGIVEFGEAAAMVRQSLPDARFVAVGEWIDHPRAAPIERLQQWRDSGSIDFRDSTGDVRPFIEAADCVVLPSYREGLPRVLLEAAAMARPAIAADVPGCRDAVDDGATGFLCQRGSSSSLAAAMLAFSGLSAAERSEMGLRARKKAENQFAQERVIQSYVTALATIIR